MSILRTTSLLRRIRSVLAPPGVAIAAAALLALDAAMLPTGPREVSTAGIWLFGAWRGSSHPYPFPVEFFRTTEGLRIVSRVIEPESVSADSASLPVSVFRPTFRRRGFWAPTNELRYHSTLGLEVLTPAERAELPARLAGVLGTIEGLPEQDLTLLRRGLWQERSVLWSGYIHNTVSAMLACVTLLAWWVAVPESIRRVRAWRGSRRMWKGRCPECRYDLRFKFERGCPECGWGRSTGN